MADYDAYSIDLSSVEEAPEGGNPKEENEVPRELKKKKKRRRSNEKLKTTTKEEKRRDEWLTFRITKAKGNTTAMRFG